MTRKEYTKRIIESLKKKGLINEAKLRQYLKESESRPLYQIAKEIKADWKKPYFGAVPYIEAMSEIDSIGSKYYEDSAKSIVAYFLANAQTWKGEKAKQIKIELKNMLKSRGYT